VRIVANQFVYKDHQDQLARKGLLGEEEPAVMALLGLPALKVQWGTLGLPALKDLLAHFLEDLQAM
jgi:hypothetical protein